MNEWMKESESILYTMKLSVMQYSTENHFGDDAL